MKVSSSDSKNPKFMIIISVEMTINSKKAYNDNFTLLTAIIQVTFQCSDTVGWVSEKASGL